MTRKVSDIVDGLRNTYCSSNTSEIANEARALIVHIDAQAAEIERLRFALAEIHAEFVHGSRKLYSTPDSALDRIRATAANELKGT